MVFQRTYSLMDLLVVYRSEKVDTTKFLMVNNFLKWTIL